MRIGVATVLSVILLVGAVLVVRANTATTAEPAAEERPTEEPSSAARAAEPSREEQTGEWPIVEVETLLRDFQVNPEEAESRYRQVRIVGRVERVSNDAARPYMMLDDKPRYDGLLVLLPTDHSFQARKGSTVMVHCRETRAGPVEVPVLLGGATGMVPTVWPSAGPTCAEPVQFEHYQVIRPR